MKRILSVLLAAVLGASIITGCTSKKDQDTNSETNGNSGENKTIKVLSLGDGWDATLEPIFREYEKQNPGIKVKCEYYPFGQYFQVLEVKVGSGGGEFDIINVDSPLTAAYTEREYIQPLDEYFTKDDINGFVEASIIAGTVDDHFMSAPMNTSGQVLYYNKNYLDAAGIPYPEADPEKRLTWEEVVKLAEKAQKAVDPDGSKGIAGLMFNQISKIFQLLPLPLSLGGQAIGSDTLTVDGVINSPEWIKALEFYKDVFDSGLGSKTWDQSEIANNFSAEKTVFHVGPVFLGKKWAETDGFKDFGYTYHPYFAGSTPVTPTGSWNYGLTKTSKNPAEAAKLIKYLTLGEGNQKWLEERGDVPSTVAGIKNVETAEMYQNFPSDAMKLVAYEASNTAVPRPVTVGFSEYETVMSTTLEDIRSGMDVKEALDSAVSQLNGLLTKYKK